METQTKRETRTAEPSSAPGYDLSVEAAARRVYDSECALHAARVAGVDEWIAAAADRLHTALVSYLEANAATPQR
jgi:hypothetical protein